MTYSGGHVSKGGDAIDDACASRRNMIKEQIVGHERGEVLPEVAYTEEEDALWETVIAELQDLHPAVACARYLDAADRLKLPVTNVPSLGEVSSGLERTSGFRLLPAPGLVPVRDFYTSFTDGYFHSALYMRCPATPLYSPDPDILHELVGHAVMLSDPLFADLYRLFGEAAVRARSERELDAISQVFWFTMETGVIREGAGLRAYGAALLSSVGELTSLREVSVEEFSIEMMTRLKYDIYQYQPVLFVVDSYDHLANELRSFLGRRISAGHAG
ncbi:phenylalanine 4-monooxygenase [Actinomadura monticuli]|uniref:Phenylalanine 4-monooxygenase n=1 Tax=Actinomadura monticuli TaxID=3097367 RepID=A0ABV4Q4V1_9ACTN